MSTSSPVVCIITLVFLLSMLAGALWLLRRKYLRQQIAAQSGGAGSLANATASGADGNNATTDQYKDNLAQLTRYAAVLGTSMPDFLAGAIRTPEALAKLLADLERTVCTRYANAVRDAVITNSNYGRDKVFLSMLLIILGKENFFEDKDIDLFAPLVPADLMEKTLLEMSQELPTGAYVIAPTFSSLTQGELKLYAPDQPDANAAASYHKLSIHSTSSHCKRLFLLAQSAINQIYSVDGFKTYGSEGLTWKLSGSTIEWVQSARTVEAQSNEPQSEPVHTGRVHLH